MAVIRVFYYLGHPEERAKVIAPLLSLMHRSSEIERVVLGNCLVIARDYPVGAPFFVRRKRGAFSRILHHVDASSSLSNFILRSSR